MSDLAWALEEYLELAGRGEAPGVEEWVARHPDIADELASALSALEFLHRSDEPQFGKTLGDFQLVREIARGGMGVVYEATQSTLDRRVALKVLPFAAVLDSRQLQRFRSESQAAAHLHHANIVPVFAVGQEHGVHYYAMQYVDGRSLAELTSELQQGSSSA
ncbi:MAG: protein kinase domain-containing protein, partial [Planctomycetota bacterium]